MKITGELGLQLADFGVTSLSLQILLHASSLLGVGITEEQ